VLGARVEAAGDAMRAWPLPGEDVTITWIVTAPDALPPHAWTLVACVANPSRTGCADAPFAVLDGAGAVPIVAFTTPDAATLGDAGGLLVLGVICADGTPAAGATDDALPGCAGDDATATVVKLDVPIATTAASNRRPTLAPDAASFDGAAWLAIATGDEPARQGCATSPPSAAVPHVHVEPGKDAPELDLAIATLAADREPIDDTRETLQLSSFATDGELSNQFAFIEADDDRAAPTAALTWTPPNAADIPAGGMRVRFTFVLRDGRGGLDVTTRVACAVTP
jgi:hypothetical protein